MKLIKQNSGTTRNEPEKTFLEYRYCNILSFSCPISSFLPNIQDLGLILTTNLKLNDISIQVFSALRCKMYLKLKPILVDNNMDYERI